MKKPYSLDDASAMLLRTQDIGYSHAKDSEVHWRFQLGDTSCYPSRGDIRESASLHVGQAVPINR